MAALSLDSAFFLETVKRQTGTDDHHGHDDDVDDDGL